jgi:hypothetical protein
MTIDPTTPEKYRLRNGCEVVRIIPTPEVSDTSCRMTVLYRRNGEVYLSRCSEDGKYHRDEHGYDLIPHDPVRYYMPAYLDGPGDYYTEFDRLVRMTKGFDLLARIAVHESGKVRQIPLDATTDEQEGGRDA